MYVLYIQGGNNAGHTVKVGSQAYDFHLLPRYVLHDYGASTTKTY